MTEMTYAVATTAAMAPTPSLFARIAARLAARHLDRLVMTGAPPQVGSALEAHMSRLSSAECRGRLAAELRRRGTLVLCDRVILSSRVNPPAVWDAADLIERAEKRLVSHRAVSPRGVTRLRRLLADWNGPLRRAGSGDLCSELRAVLAAL
ncbi:MAG: hypothetical protein NVSMB60_31500 [Mycobacterium sp.]